MFGSKKYCRFKIMVSSNLLFWSIGKIGPTLFFINRERKKRIIVVWTLKYYDCNIIWSWNKKIEVVQWSLKSECLLLVNMIFTYNMYIKFYKYMWTKVFHKIKYNDDIYTDQSIHFKVFTCLILCNTFTS